MHKLNPMETTKTVSKSLILEIAAEMTANDFINEFQSLITIDSIDNTMDANDDLVNVYSPVKGGEPLYITTLIQRYLKRYFLGV